MKTETLEIIIEELTSALSIARWRNEVSAERISELEKEIVKLEAKAKEERGQK